MEHTILPRMSNYRVMHTDYIRTHGHTLDTIYVHVHDPVQSPHNGILSLEKILMQANNLCTAWSVLPCICNSICTVSHACIVCICHNKDSS